jgi:dTDP-4-dehydrorhamnose 3,5-epimerase-like enzyme
VEFIDLRRFNDEGGSMTELGRLAANGLIIAQNFTVAQMNYSVVEPGAIKAFHLAGGRGYLVRAARGQNAAGAGGLALQTGSSFGCRWRPRR